MKSKLRIALVASPFIPVPPVRYGGTELFIANLAEGLARLGAEPVVYSNGDSTVPVESRWCYPRSEWPATDPSSSLTKELNHLSWAMSDAARDCDLIHINSAPGVTYSRFLSCPVVCTLHHPLEAVLLDLYQRHSGVFYSAISHHQASLHPALEMRTIHHGLDLAKYRMRRDKESYLCFLGRIAPIKGTHTAIEVAKKIGIPLKIAGEIQPIFRDYYDTAIKPHVDGRFIEYVGEADLEEKNELLGGSMGMLFPIHWEEPFGLVMLESMACGTPVFAFPWGAVPEIVCEGVSGAISTSAGEMARSIGRFSGTADTVRNWVESMFSADLMADRYLKYYRDIIAGRVGVSPRSRAARAIEETEPAA